MNHSALVLSYYIGRIHAWYFLLKVRFFYTTILRVQRTLLLGGGESFFISLPPTFIQFLLKMPESADGARQDCSLQRALVRCRDDISSTLPSPVPSSIPAPCHPHKETNGHIPVAPLTTRTFSDIVSAPKKVLRPMAPRAGFVKKAQRKRKSNTKYASFEWGYNAAFKPTKKKARKWDPRTADDNRWRPMTVQKQIL